MTRLHHFGRTVAVLALLAASAGCRDPEYPGCDDGCADGTLCWYGENVCVPRPDDGGTCPDGTVYQECATGSCPTCRDCVPACIPEYMLAAGS